MFHNVTSELEVYRVQIVRGVKRMSLSRQCLSVGDTEAVVPSSNIREGL